MLALKRAQMEDAEKIGLIEDAVQLCSVEMEHPLLPLKRLFSCGLATFWKQFGETARRGQA